MRGLKSLFPQLVRHSRLSHPSRVRGLKYTSVSFTVSIYIVAPLAGAWIEIFDYYIQANYEPVAPLAGAWIEIVCIFGKFLIKIVAPLAGAWIEIRTNFYRKIFGKVAPLAGAWIEICKTTRLIGSI